MGFSQNDWVWTEKWESGELPIDHVLGKRWTLGTAEMAQATVSRSAAEETPFPPLGVTEPIPETCRSFRPIGSPLGQIVQVHGTVEIRALPQGNYQQSRS